jgi:hypothetical protein
VISPCLSNIFLHHVLDEWFESEVRPRLRGRSALVRFADDAILAFETYHDAKRVLDVLGKRFGRYGLRLHPTKTRFVDFRFTRPDGKQHPETDGTTFTFLGFCHVWGKSRKGKSVVRQVTAKKRYARALAAVTAWCRANRHGMHRSLLELAASQPDQRWCRLLSGAGPSREVQEISLGSNSRAFGCARLGLLGANEPN